MSNYDVIVIGAGPAGYVGAIRAAQLGLNTAIVDKQWLGGVCLNIGCIPSKALLKNAEVIHTLRERGKEFGFSIESFEVDYSVAVKRSRKVSDRLTKGVGFLMKKNKIDVHMGTAKFVDQNSIEVTDSDGKSQTLQGKNIIIATGASSIVPSGWEVDGKHILTYVEAILQEHLPKSVIVIGSGAIGVEFATIWNSYGVDVTIVEMLPKILPLEEQEVSSELAKAFKKQGIEVLTNHKVTSLELKDDSVEVKTETDGEENILNAEQALIAIGVKPNSGSLGLEKIGVKLDDKGMVEIDDRMATNVPGVWAIGDVTGKLMLAHVGSAQGIVCAENIAGQESIILDYEMLPKVTFSQPQVASFGLSEAVAEDRGYEVKVGRYPFQANGKALGLGESAGWVKIITDAKYGEILGAHMIGPEVTELLPELTLAQMMEITTAEIAQNVHAHPTLSEVLMEAAHGAEGHSINI